MQFRLRPSRNMPPANAVFYDDPSDQMCDPAHPGQWLHVGHTPLPSRCGSGFAMVPLYAWACIECSN
jgi:hypothetical protein